jgi:hypothetical protein
LLLLPLLRPLAHRLLTVSRAAELRLLLGVILALGGGVLAENVGVSSGIGALLTGVMLAYHPKTDDISDKLWSLKELFLVAFFLQIGLSDFPTQEQALTALGLLFILPLQGGLFFMLFVLAGLRTRTAFVSSLALMTYSEFALITTGAVVNANLLPEEWKSIISLAVAGSLAIAAHLNRYSHRLFSWAEPVLIRFEKNPGILIACLNPLALRNGSLSGWGAPAFPLIWRCTNWKNAWWDWMPIRRYWKTCLPRADAWFTAMPKTLGYGADCRWKESRELF